MKNFKIGDRVRRININHYSMQIGDIGTIGFVPLAITKYFE